METTQSLQFGAIAVGLFGGLAIFLYGMEHLTDALKKVAGSRMRQLLARLTTNRFKAVLAGSIVTATIQSSSVTTVLLVGFVSAGLMTLQQSIGVIMGAEIGTTITAQIIAFKITKVALVAVAVGFFVQFVAKRDIVRQYGLMVLGFGLIFFGMNLMGESTEPLRTYGPFIGLMQSMNNPLLGIALSAGFTALVQSSSATTGLIIVLASQGFITLPAGIALVFGANIGTCVTALLASIGKPREAVRTAMIHVTFNVAGVLLWLGFIDELAQFVTWLSPAADTLVGSARLAAETPRQIANAHTTFNLANTFVFIWFTPLFAWWVTRLVPERDAAPELGAQPKYLDDLLLDTPSWALDRARMEITRIAERVVEMVRQAPPAVVEASEVDLQRVRSMDEDIDALHAAVISYLGRLSHQGMGDPESDRLQDLLAIANNFEAIADIVETNVVASGFDALEQQVKMSDATRKVMGELYDEVLWSVEAAADAVYKWDPEIAMKVIDHKSRVTHLSERTEEQLATRLASNEPNRMATYRVEASMIENLKRIYYFAKRVAKTVVDAHGTSVGPERLAAPDLASVT